MTAASTSRRSHRHGARREPSSTAASGSAGSSGARPASDASASWEPLRATPARSWARDRARRRPRLARCSLRIRHLTEREILRESPRREPFRRAREERQDRAAGGVGAARPAREIGGNRGAAERLLEMRR
jgi:hypothetical protein